MPSPENADAPSDTRMSLRQRIIVAIGFGLLIGVVAAQAFWQGGTKAYAAHGPPSSTRFWLQRVAGALEAFTAERGALPADLGVLAEWERTATGSDHPPKAPPYRGHSGFREGAVRDAWERPINYVQAEGGFRLTSLGADGVAGGEGADADIICTGSGIDLRVTGQAPTFSQFLGVRGRTGARLMLSAGLSGAFAGMLCFVLLRRRLTALILPGIATLLATFVVAQVIGMTDVVKIH